MPPPSGTRIPSYRRYKPTGQAVVTLSDRDIYLGLYGSPRSRKKYNCLIAEWLAAGRQIPRESAEITIGEVLNGYRKFAETYYRRPDGTPTGEFDRVRRELK